MKSCLLFIDGVSLCERRGTGMERNKNLREQSCKRELKKTSAAERSAELEVAERARSGEQRSQKWALMRSGKTAAPLRSNAWHRSNRVSAEKIRTDVLYVRFNRLFTQSAVRQYNNQTVYLICWNATVLAFCLWPTTFTGAPFRLQTICWSGVPPSSGTTTALLTMVTETQVLLRTEMYPMAIAHIFPIHNSNHLNESVFRDIQHFVMADNWDSV